MATGMDKDTGRAIDEIAHIQQSIANILATRIGTLVEHRAYGSRNSELLDDPIDQRFRVESIAAAAQAIRRWEKRVTPERIQLLSASSSGATFRLSLLRRRDGQRLSLDV